MNQISLKDETNTCHICRAGETQGGDTRTFKVLPFLVLMWKNHVSSAFLVRRHVLSSFQNLEIQHHALVSALP